MSGTVVILLPTRADRHPAFAAAVERNGGIYSTADTLEHAHIFPQQAEAVMAVRKWNDIPKEQRRGWHRDMPQAVAVPVGEAPQVASNYNRG